MNKTKKIDFEKKLNEVYPNEFKILGEYINNRTKILIKHNVCGESYDRYPNDLINKRYSKCKYCHQIERMKKKIDNYIIKNNLEETYSYDLNGAKYQYEKMIVCCNECNNNFEKVIDLFLLGQHCMYCSGQKTNKNSAQSKINKKVGENKFLLLNDNINSYDSQVEVLHFDCGRTFETSLNYFYTQKTECHHCLKDDNREKRMKTTEQFEKEIKNLYGNEFKLISKYNGASESVKLIHKHCKKEIEVKANHVLQYNFGCKYCNMSMPESIINSLLVDNNITFEFQYKFEDCIGITGLRLPFDFIVFDKENNIKFIIEYDGQQHFSEKAFGKESYERTLRNDKIKNDFCKNKNLKLYRISYKELKNLKDIVLFIIKNEFI